VLGARVGRLISPWAKSTVQKAPINCTHAIVIEYKPAEVIEAGVTELDPLIPAGRRPLAA
jgi:hypothetical protein